MNIGKKIVEMLAVTLGVDEAMITSDAQLIDDLGAESIDFIDICYQLEKNFNIGRVDITDIYPEEMYGEFSKDSVESIVKKNPYMDKTMMGIMLEQNTYRIIGSVYAICEFVQWRIEHSDGEE